MNGAFDSRWTARAARRVAVGAGPPGARSPALARNDPRISSDGDNPVERQNGAVAVEAEAAGEAGGEGERVDGDGEVAGDT